MFFPPLEPKKLHRKELGRQSYRQCATPDSFFYISKLRTLAGPMAASSRSNATAFIGAYDAIDRLRQRPGIQLNTRPERSKLENAS